jgi:small GTP-binding protein
LIGESGVGKTSIISRYTTNTFDPQTLTSSSAQFLTKTINLNENTSIKFDIWDTAGQEKFKSLAKIFYKDAKVIILVYDITNKPSFETLKNYWYKEIMDNSISDLILAIVGNKSDLYENEQVSDKEGKLFAKEINAIFKSTSALSNRGINSLFTDIAKKCLDPNYDYLAEDKKMQEEYNQRKINEMNERNKGKINLNNNKENDVKKGCC